MSRSQEKPVVPKSRRPRRGKDEDADPAPRGWWRIPGLLAFRVIGEAVRAVPPVKYALGVGGIVAVVALISLMGVNLRVAAFAAPVMFVLMVVLVVFRHVVSAPPENFALQTLVFTWAALVVILATVVLLLTSAFFNGPMPLRDILLQHSPPPPHTPTPDSAAEKRSIASALAQSEGGDYAGAWRLITNALQGAPESSALKEAQAQIAMAWLRNLMVTEGKETFAQFVDPLLPCLNERAAAAHGPDAADALAHIGWGYFMKYREGDIKLAVADQFDHALKIDPTNAYAHSMWAYWIAYTDGPFAQVQQHLSAALQSGRVRPFVREMQIAALRSADRSDTFDVKAETIRACDEMRRNHEPLSADDRREVLSHAYDMDGDSADVLLGKVNPLVPPAEHVKTYDWLAREVSAEAGFSKPFWRARLTEAAGDYADAMDRYLALSGGGYIYQDRIIQGVDRCAAHGVDLSARLTAMLQDRDPARRSQGAAAAGALGAKARALLKPLLDAVKDPEPRVRASAATALAKIETDAKDVVPSLAKALLDSDPEVRQAAGQALRDIGPLAVDSLTEMLGASEPRDRMNAATTLHEIGAPAASATPALLKAVGDPEPKVRIEVIDALGAVTASYDAIGPDLIRILQEERNPSVRDAAARALRNFGADAQPAVPALSAALTRALDSGDDGDGFHATTLAETLGEIGPPAGTAVPVLIKALQSDHLRVPTAAATALGLIGANARPAIRQLTETLAHEEKKYVNVQAKPLAQIAQALAEARNTQALPDLKRALSTMRQRPEVDAEWSGMLKDAIDALQSGATAAPPTPATNRD